MVGHFLHDMVAGTWWHIHSLHDMVESPGLILRHAGEVPGLGSPPIRTHMSLSIGH